MVIVAVLQAVTNGHGVGPGVIISCRSKLTIDSRLSLLVVSVLHVGLPRQLFELIEPCVGLRERGQTESPPPVGLWVLFSWCQNATTL